MYKKADEDPKEPTTVASVTKAPLAYSIDDYNTVGSLFKILGGLGLLSIGGGALYAGVNAYKKRFMEASAPDQLRPSKLIKNRGQDTQIEIEPEFFSNKDKEKVAYYTKQILKSAETKDVFVDANSESWPNYIAGRTAIPPSEAAYKNPIILYSEALKNPNVNKLQAWLATFPNLRASWFLPAATATIIGGAFIGKHAVKAFNDLLGRDKPTINYSEKAKKIYEDSANYLKDVAEGNIDFKTGKRIKKDKIKKEAATKTPTPLPPGTVVSGDGTSNFNSFFGLLFGIPLALWAGRQTYNFTKGFDDSKEELADRTHMVRAWQAAAKERQYNYNILTPEIKNEPIDDEVLKSIKRKEKKLLNETAKDDDNNEQLRYENYVFRHIRDDRDSMV